MATARNLAHNVFQENFAVVPAPSHSTLLRGTTHQGYVLNLDANTTCRLPPSLPTCFSSAPVKHIALRYCVTLYDATTRAFFGRTYRSPRFIPLVVAGTNNSPSVFAMCNNNNAQLSLQTTQGDIVYLVSSYKDPQVLIVIEPTLVAVDAYGNALHEVSIGWSYLSLNGHQDISSSTSSSVPLQTPPPPPQVSELGENGHKRCRTPIYSGTARGLLIANPPTPSSSFSTSSPLLVTGGGQNTISTTLSSSSSSSTGGDVSSSQPTLIYGFHTFKQLRLMRHLVKDSCLFGPLDVIPGLKPTRVHSSVYSPIIPTTTATIPNNDDGDHDDDEEGQINNGNGTTLRKAVGGPNSSTSSRYMNDIPCLAPTSPDLFTIPQSPQIILPTLAFTFKKLCVYLPPFFELQILQAAIANREVELGMRQGSMPANLVRIQSRTLYASVHNGHTAIHAGSVSMNIQVAASPQQQQFVLNGDASGNNMAVCGELAVTGGILLLAENDLMLSHYVPHEFMALTFKLEYLISEPTGAALGLKARRDLAPPSGDAMCEGLTADSGIQSPGGPGAGFMIPVNNMKLEHQRRVLVAHQLYVPFETGTDLIGNRLMLANRRRPRKQQDDPLSPSSTSSSSFTGRSLELPLESPNTKVIASSSSLSRFSNTTADTAVLLDGGEFVDVAPPPPASSTSSSAIILPSTTAPSSSLSMIAFHAVLGTDVTVSVETRKPATAREVTISGTTTTAAAATTITGPTSNSNNRGNITIAANYGKEPRGNERDRSHSENSSDHDEDRDNSEDEDNNTSSRRGNKSPHRSSAPLTTSLSPSRNNNDNRTTASSAVKKAMYPQREVPGGSPRGRKINTSNVSLKENNNDDDDIGYESPDSIIDPEDDYEGSYRDRENQQGRYYNNMTNHSSPGRRSSSFSGNSGDTANILGDLLSLRVGAHVSDQDKYYAPIIMSSDLGGQKMSLQKHQSQQQQQQYQKYLPSVMKSISPFDTYPTLLSPYGHVLTTEELSIMSIHGVPAAVGDGSGRPLPSALGTLPWYSLSGSESAVLQTELSDPLSVNVITLSFITFTPSVIASTAPRSIYFAFQFYNSPFVRTAPVHLTSRGVQQIGASATKTSATSVSPLTLECKVMGSASTFSSSSPDFLSVRISVDPNSMPASERVHVLSYMAHKALSIEVWDADSMLPVGNVSFQLSQLLRQQANSKTFAVSCDVVNCLALEEPVTSGGGAAGHDVLSMMRSGNNFHGAGGGSASTHPAASGLPAPHPAAYAGLTAGVVVGRLLVVASCIGCKGKLVNNSTIETSSSSSSSGMFPPPTIPTMHPMSSGTAFSPRDYNIAVSAPTTEAFDARRRNKKGVVITGRQARVKVQARPLSLDDNNASSFLPLSLHGAGRHSSLIPSTIGNSAEAFPVSASVLPSHPPSLSIEDTVDGDLASRQIARAAAAGTSSIHSSSPKRPQLLLDQENEDIRRATQLVELQSFKDGAVAQQRVSQQLKERVSATYQISPSYGRPSFMEYTVRNTSSSPDIFTVRMDDAGGELRIVTTAAEWAYLRSSAPLACMDEGLGPRAAARQVIDMSWNDQLQVMLAPGEALTIPLVYTAIGANHDNNSKSNAITTASMGGRPFSSSAAGIKLSTIALKGNQVVPIVSFSTSKQVTGAIENEFQQYQQPHGVPVPGPFGAQAESSFYSIPRSMRVEISSRERNGENVAVLCINTSSSPGTKALGQHQSSSPSSSSSSSPIVHRTIRYFQAEGAYLRTSIPLPPFPVQSSVGGGESCAPVFVACHDPSVVAQIVASSNTIFSSSFSSDGGGGLELLLRYKVGAFPSTGSFYILLYADPFHDVLLECWRIVVHAVLSCDVASVSGARTNLDLVVRGSGYSRLAKVYSSRSNEEISLAQTNRNINNNNNASLMLLPTGLTRIPVTFQPLLPTVSTALPVRPAYITLVEDVENIGSGASKALVCMWQLSVTTSMPAVSRIYDILLPTMRKPQNTTSSTIIKKLAYTNAWPRKRSVSVSVSHPRLVSVVASVENRSSSSSTSSSSSAEVLPNNIIELPPRSNAVMRLAFRADITTESQENVFVYIADETGELEDTIMLRVLYSPSAISKDTFPPSSMSPNKLNSSSSSSSSRRVDGGQSKRMTASSPRGETKGKDQNGENGRRLRTNDLDRE